MYNDLYSGLIYDVLYTDLKYRTPFVLSNNIKPAWDFNTIVFGKAFTCRGKEVGKNHILNEKIRLTMLSKILRNCVMVYDTNTYYPVAHFGDITATIAKKAGCKGVIIDGCTRDIKKIKQLKFPIFCRGFSPIDSYGHWQIIEYEKNILLEGILGKVLITPYDYIFADKTGILVIPNHLILKTLDKAKIRLKKENNLKKNILRNKNLNLIEAYNNLGIH